MLTKEHVWIETFHSRIFRFIAALSISLLTAFNLGAKSNNTRNAWRKLNLAIIEFNEKMITKNALISADEQGESLIGGVNYSLDRIQRDELVTDNEFDEIRKPHQPQTEEESQSNEINLTIRKNDLFPTIAILTNFFPSIILKVSSKNDTHLIHLGYAHQDRLSALNSQNWKEVWFLPDNLNGKIVF